MRPRRFDLTFWSLVIVFWVFWIIVTGSFHYQSLLLGAVMAFFVAWMNDDMFFRKDERSLLDVKAVGLYLRYMIHLVGAILVANIQVAALVLSPRMPISPGMIRFSRPLKKDLNRTILANSITLTPGTLTILVEGDEYMVHALTRKNAEDVVNWELAGELAEIEHAQEHTQEEA